MFSIVDEQENYLLVTDGVSFTVVERRAGRFYPLRKCSRPGVALDDAGVAKLFRESGHYAEPEARRLLGDVAGQWRDLWEHIR